MVEPEKAGFALTCRRPQFEGDSRMVTG